MLQALGAFAAELREAARRLARNPRFGALGIGMLAVGIGTQSAMLAVMDALLFRPPFGVTESAQVVRLRFRLHSADEDSIVERTHYPAFSDLRESGAFQAVAAYTPAVVSIGYGPGAHLANAMLVSHDFFDVLRPRPSLGRLSFGDDLDETGDAAVIAYGFAHREFGDEVSPIGAKLTIDGRVYSVAGVAPRDFQPLSATPTDVWLPLEHATVADIGPDAWRNNRGPLWLRLVARRKPTTTAAAAEAHASAVLQNRLGDPDVRESVMTTSIVPGRGADKSIEARVSLWLSGVSGLVLLIACCNVANLLLTRAFGRRREYFIRLSLGAPRRRLVLAALLDALVMVGCALVAGLFFSYVLRNGMAGLLSRDIPLSRDLLDPRLLMMTCGIGSVVYVVLSAVSLSQPFRRSAETAPLGEMQPSGRPGRRMRRTLMAAQATVCLLLVWCAGLFTTSLRRVDTLDLGVDLSRTIQVTLDFLPGQRTREERSVVYTHTRDRLAGHPMVASIALTAGSPFMSGMAVAPWSAERSRAELWPANEEVAYRSAVGARFFTAIGDASLRGRDFNERDRPGAQRVAIVNAPLAKRLWPAKDPIGECMWLDDPAICVRVVGVTGGVWKFDPFERNKMAVYVPLSQVDGAVPSTMFIRATGDPDTVLEQVRSMVQGDHPDLPAARVAFVRDVLEPDVRPWRLAALVSVFFAGVALLIAAVGLYGVVAASATLRLRETAIRLALGAGWPHVIRLVLGEATASVVAGLLAGVLIVLDVASRLGPVLFETSPTDPAVLTGAALVLLVAGSAGAAVPVSRALRTDAARVLRLE